MRNAPPAKDVDAYLEAAPEAARDKLVQLRRMVRAMVPEAEEGISYGMPYYKFHGALVGFAAFRNHIGFFPGAIVGDFKRELAGYETARGTVRLPLDKPLPLALLKKLLAARLKKNKAKALKIVRAVRRS